MRLNRITPAQLIAILTLLALLAVYLALNTMFWEVFTKCGAFCSLLMSDTAIRMFTR